MGAHEVAHVLHYTQHRNTDALEHLRAAQGIAHRDLLRRGHDDGGADMYRLRERELRVACPRWQVHEKVVELSPVHILHELPDHLHDDGAAPDGRRVSLDDERERNERSEEHTSELQSHSDLVCRLLLEKKKTGDS